MSFAKNASPRLKMAFCSNIIYQLKLKNGKNTSLYSDLEVAWQTFQLPLVMTGIQRPHLPRWREIRVDLRNVDNINPWPFHLLYLLCKSCFIINYNRYHCYILRNRQHFALKKSMFSKELLIHAYIDIFSFKPVDQYV